MAPLRGQGRTVQSQVTGNNSDRPRLTVHVGAAGRKVSEMTIDRERTRARALDRPGRRGVRGDMGTPRRRSIERSHRADAIWLYQNWTVLLNQYDGK